MEPTLNIFHRDVRSFGLGQYVAFDPGCYPGILRKEISQSRNAYQTRPPVSLLQEGLKLPESGNRISGQSPDDG